jgi:hypothetical protein
MEKKSSRQILYNKKTEPPQEQAKKAPPPVQKAESPPPPKKEVAIELTPKEKSDKIKEWLRGHKLFKPSVIAKEIGVDKGNWSRILKAGDIPEKHLEQIINLLKQYGFKL